MAPSRKSWSFTIPLYWDFSKSWSQIQKVGVNNSKFGVNETSASDLDFASNEDLYQPGHPPTLISLHSPHEERYERSFTTARTLIRTV